MPRVKRSVHARKKRRKVLHEARGYWGLKHSSYKRAKEQVDKSLVYAYRDRKAKKRTFRRLWILRINAAARREGLSYNQFVAGENVSPELLASVSTLAHPPRRLAVFRWEDLPNFEAGAAPSTGLALWRVGDPGNLGAILRAADGLGPAFVGLSSGCADPTGPKALRASMGAVFRVPLGRFEEAPGLRVALVAQGGT